MGAVTVPSARTGDELTGLVSYAASTIEFFGEWGVGVLTFAETVFPPIPSEVILPLAGFLTRQGDLDLVLVFITSVLGGYLGALLLYWIGAKLGLKRSIRWLSRLPLVDRTDVERAAKWFEQHGRSAVFFGRLIPGVRSLISLPAGAEHMNLLTFSIFTLAGTAVWNGILIGLGAALGAQYAVVDQYSHYLNYALYAAIAGLVIMLVIRRAKQRNHTIP
ncbi:alanine dehydrogenase [Arthrobacter sp. RIT-PI-e]|uniref:DedA family protein n=1 Tax=Arthrobacter sp. RIT-PI-e TaxID=1681197 RepID=UPI000675F513|nr:DedA family protein [Arthrobacter sp. RIT-PI-e]KNC18345.1 alanine dehydrogenase [Arthrobacter sp. RIT-PI-e]